MEGKDQLTDVQTSAALASLGPSLKETTTEPWLGGSVGWSIAPVHQKVVGSIPGQGTCLGCGDHPQSGHMQRATDRCFSLTSVFFSLPPTSSLSKVNKNISLSEDLKKEEITTEFLQENFPTVQNLK